MNINWLILLPGAFIAAFVDAIAGGGGIISIPAFILSGFPMHYALGTNKFGMSTGTLISTWRFYKDGKVNFDFLKFLIPCSLIGSLLWTVHNRVPILRNHGECDRTRKRAV